MRAIPLQAVPSQSLSALLAGQNCQINVYQKSTGMYLDLLINNAPVLTAVMCRDRVRLIRQTYHGFVGDLAFVDTQGKGDPEYAGLGLRYLLVYLEPVDLL
jgi:hypothetical protein